MLPTVQLDRLSQWVKGCDWEILRRSLSLDSPRLARIVYQHCHRLLRPESRAGRAGAIVGVSGSF